LYVTRIFSLKAHLPKV